MSGFHYKAFISYRHVPLDRKWAAWLVHELETYKTPRTLVREGINSRVGRIFRDDDESSASSSLSANIRQALDTSEYLIVVCSPNTPQSLWVRSEIQYFLGLGRRDKVLILLVAGEPSQSFPPELLHPSDAAMKSAVPSLIDLAAEPMAADARQRSNERKSATRNRALLRLVASLLQVNFDDLVRRERRRRTVRLRLQAAALSGAFVVLIGAVYGSISVFKLKNRQDANFIITEKKMARAQDADELVRGEDTFPGITAYCSGGKIGLANTTDKSIVLSIGEYQTDNIAELAVLRPNNYYYFDAPEAGRWILSAAGNVSSEEAEKPKALFVFDTKPCKPNQLAP